MTTYKYRKESIEVDMSTGKAKLYNHGVLVMEHTYSLRNAELDEKLKHSGFKAVTK